MIVEWESLGNIIVIHGLLRKWCNMNDESLTGKFRNHVFWNIEKVLRFMVEEYCLVRNILKRGWWTCWIDGWKIMWAFPRSVKGEVESWNLWALKLDNVL